MMLEDLQRRNYAENTIRSYIRIVKDFSRRFQRSPERLGPKHIREYQSELFTKRKYRASTVTLYLAALRFFYTKTLKRAGSIAETPYPKRAFSLPTILSQEEVAQLIDAASPPVNRIAVGIFNLNLFAARAYLPFIFKTQTRLFQVSDAQANPAPEEAHGSREPAE